MPQRGQHNHRCELAPWWKKHNHPYSKDGLVAASPCIPKVIMWATSTIPPGSPDGLCTCPLLSAQMGTGLCAVFKVSLTQISGSRETLKYERDWLRILKTCIHQRLHSFYQWKKNEYLPRAISLIILLCSEWLSGTEFAESPK